MMTLWQSILDARDKLRHQHRESAISDERDDLTTGMRDLGRDRVRKTAGDARQIARYRMHLAASSRDMTCPPSCDRAAVAAHDRVFLEPRA